MDPTVHLGRMLDVQATITMQAEHVCDEFVFTLYHAFLLVQIDWRILFLQVLWMRIVLFVCSSTKVSIAGAAAICLIIMAVSWYQGAIFGVDTGLLVCGMLPDGMSQSWY